MTYKVTGYIIGKRLSREQDRIFVLYTKEQGKIDTLAQGVLRLESKLSGNLELLVKGSFLLARGRVLDRVAGVDVENRFCDIKNNIQKLIVACYGMELVNTLVKGRVCDPSLFALLEDFLSELEKFPPKTKTQKALHLAHLFILKFSLVLGYRSNAQEAKRFLDRLQNNALGVSLSQSMPSFIPTLINEFFHEQLSKKLMTQSYLDLLACENIC